MRNRKEATRWFARINDLIGVGSSAPPSTYTAMEMVVNNLIGVGLSKHSK